jgi:hypothetical protein
MSMSTPETRPDAPKPDRRPFQYSLAELFVSTFIVSGGASLLKCFPKAWPLVLNVSIWIAAIYIVYRFSPLSSDRKIATILLALMLAHVTTLTIPRLLAEAITPTHHAEFHRLFTDPLVVKTIASAEGKPLSEEKIAERIQKAADHLQQRGFGSWVFRLKKDGLFIGLGGLKIHQVDGEAMVGLGYADMPDS